MNDPDSGLLEEAISGNKQAFGDLVKKYRQKVFFLAFDLVGNYEEAKDIAQEAFIRSYVRLHQFQGRSLFSTWLYRITVNLAMDLHRRKKRIMVPFDKTVKEVIDFEWSHQEQAENPRKKTEQHELQKILQKAIDQLSSNQRTATILKYFHGKNSREIAEIMGCAESTVRIHIFRAMANLRKNLNHFE